MDVDVRGYNIHKFIMMSNSWSRRL